MSVGKLYLAEDYPKYILPLVPSAEMPSCSDNRQLDGEDGKMFVAKLVELNIQ